MKYDNMVKPASPLSLILHLWRPNFTSSSKKFILTASAHRPVLYIGFIWAGTELYFPLQRSVCEQEALLSAGDSAQAYRTGGPGSTSYLSGQSSALPVLTYRLELDKGKWSLEGEYLRITLVHVTTPRSCPGFPCILVPSA